MAGSRRVAPGPRRELQACLRSPGDAPLQPTPLQRLQLLGTAAPGAPWGGPSVCIISSNPSSHHLPAAPSVA